MAHMHMEQERGTNTPNKDKNLVSWNPIKDNKSIIETMIPQKSEKEGKGLSPHTERAVNRLIHKS